MNEWTDAAAGLLLSLNVLSSGETAADRKQNHRNDRGKMRLSRLMMATLRTPMKTKNIQELIYRSSPGIWFASTLMSQWRLSLKPSQSFPTAHSFSPPLFLLWCCWQNAFKTCYYHFLPWRQEIFAEHQHLSPSLKKTLKGEKTKEKKRQRKLKREQEGGETTSMTFSLVRKT